MTAQCAIVPPITTTVECADLPGGEIRLVRTPVYVWAGVAAAVVVSMALIASALVSGDVVSALVTATVPAGALVRALSNSRSDVPLHLTILIVVVLVGTAVWSRSAGAAVLAALLGCSLGGAEIYRRFRLLKQARQRWLTMTDICRREHARIVWIAHASPRGTETRVSLIDPGTGKETPPKSLWGRWTSGRYACITTGRRVLATARSGDREAVNKLAKHVVENAR